MERTITIPDSRVLNLIARKPGGTASKGAYGYKITLPSAWVYAMGLSPEDKACTVTFDGEKITIEKCINIVDNGTSKGL